MTRNISQRELRNDSGEVLRAVASGEEFVVTRNGTPIAELRPLQRSFLVSTAELLQQALRLPAIDTGRFQADLDAAVDQGLDR